jgi:ElaB/YqjD/DUF883 family membrane-anchored ribosome-binding protein
LLIDPAMAAYSTTPPGVPPGVPSTTVPGSPGTATAGEPPVADERRAVERKLSRARARLFARIDELGKRVSKARNAVDVAQIIRDHPFTAVTIALSAGVLAGLPRSHKQGGASKVRNQLSALITAVAVSALRSSVSGWILDQLRAAPSSAAPSPGSAWTPPAR